MVKRIVTGAGVFVLMCVGIVFQGWVLRLMLLAAMLTAMNEMYRALRHTGAKPAAWAGYVYGVLAAGLQALSAQAAALAMDANSARGAWLVWLAGAMEGVDPAASTLTVGVLLGLTAIVARGKVAYEDMTATVIPMIYPGFLFSLLMTLQDLPTQVAATTALMLAFFLASVNDVFALFVGVKFGKHRLSPEISPKKSIEGSIGGLAASVLFAVLIGAAMNALQTTSFALPLFAEPSAQATRFSLPALAVLGLVAGVFSQAGDLTASLVKRHCGVKDYGTIFPGHGGMMDRMDGVLFCTAVVWLFFHLAMV